jgi:hypothetical protein
MTNETAVTSEAVTEMSSLANEQGPPAWPPAAPSDARLASSVIAWTASV